MPPISSPPDEIVSNTGHLITLERLVTFNLKDFPVEALKYYNLVAPHPDDFIFDLLNLNLALVCKAAAEHRRSLKNPPKTADEYLDTLLKQGLTRTVGLLRDLKPAI